MEVEVSESEIITDEIAQEMLRNGKMFQLAQNLHRAQNLSSEIAHKLYVSGYGYAVGNNLESFDIVDGY